MSNRGFAPLRTNGPIYKEVANVLEQRIRSGEWKPGDQIPTEAELETQFNASRGTLRAAVAQLVKQGLLKPQPGRGTFVLGPSFDSLERFFRYEGIGKAAQLSPEVRVLGRSIVKANKQTASVLGLASGAKVGRLRRLRLQKSEPFLVLDSFFSLEVWHQIEGADFTSHLLYDVLKDHHDLYIVSADEYLRAGLATDDEARLLNIEPRSAVIQIERIAYSFGNHPVEHRRATGRADRFRYHVKLA